MKKLLHRRPLHLALVASGLLAASAVTAVAAQPAAAPVRMTVIHCPQFIDVAAGKLVGETSIVVGGDTIREVAPGRVARDGAASIDLPAGHTCMPGLIDSHTHLTSKANSKTTYSDKFRLNPADHAIQSTVDARRTLLAGFTTVRNLGDGNYETLALRNAINAGSIPGPRVFTAGKAIGSTGGHGDPTTGYRMDLAGDSGTQDGVINSSDDARKAIRQRYKQGVDVIKLMASGGVLDESSSSENPQLTLEEIQAIVATAHDYGLTVATHAHGAESIRRAVQGGVDSIEHGTFMDDADMALMKQRGTWFVPTLMAGQVVVARAKEGGWFPPQVARKALEIGPKMMAAATRAYKAGLKIAFGTDNGHGRNAQEFAYMVEAGMPPMFTIQAATVHAAELLKQSAHLGAITAGRYADVVAVPGNPLADIAVMTRVSFVMKGGVVYKQDGQPTSAMF